MYLVKISVKDSSIEGKGVFTEESIEEGDIVWKFNPAHDKTLSQDEFKKLSDEEKLEMRKVGYLSGYSHMWIYPPENDAARFTNHDNSRNNLSEKFDAAVSKESFFFANQDIEAGEELIVNYLEFDEDIEDNKPEWI